MPTARRALARLAIAAVFAMRVEGAGALHGVVVRARPVLGHCLPTARPARRAARASAPVVCTLFSPAVFATSAGAVAELAVSAGLGYAAVRSGLLERSGVTQLARIVYNFFLPIFLFASVTRTVQTYGVSRGMLALPLVSAIQIACGLSVARLLLRALGISPALRSSRRFVTCAAFGNTGVLPLVLAEAIFRSPPYADATVLPRAASYLSFYLLGWSPIFWSLGKSILTGDGDVAAAGEPRWRQFARRVISPPIIGALGGLAFGLLCPSFVLESPRSPLRIVMQALRNIARAYPPAALLVLAGSLAGDAPVSAKAGPEQAAPMDAGRGADAQAPREMGMPTMLLGITACARCCGAPPALRRRRLRAAAARADVTRACARARAFPPPPPSPPRSPLCAKPVDCARPRARVERAARAPLRER